MSRSIVLGKPSASSIAEPKNWNFQEINRRKSYNYQKFLVRSVDDPFNVRNSFSFGYWDKEREADTDTMQGFEIDFSILSESDDFDFAQIRQQNDELMSRIELLNLITEAQIHKVNRVLRPTPVLNFFARIFPKLSGSPEKLGRKSSNFHLDFSGVNGDVGSAFVPGQLQQCTTRHRFFKRFTFWLKGYYLKENAPIKPYKRNPYKADRHTWGYSQSEPMYLYSEKENIYCSSIKSDLDSCNSSSKFIKSNFENNSQTRYSKNYSIATTNSRQIYETLKKGFLSHKSTLIESSPSYRHDYKEILDDLEASGSNNSKEECHTASLGSFSYLITA